MQTRRNFIRNAAVAASGVSLFNIGSSGEVAANSKVYHASFGAGGMALADIKNLMSHPNIEIVAVAEVDENKLPALKEILPNARVYKDWRVLLDKEHKYLNSVNVSTPDHMHAPIGITAMQMGINIYGQKPLAHTLYETRRMIQVAKEQQVVTQMGVQLASSAYERITAQMIRDGVIGKVSEVHMFSHKTWGDMKPRPKRSDPIPKGLDWNLWLGTAETRSYIKDYYHPFNWRARLDFGTGTLGDMGCHIYSPMFQALGVRYPLSVKSTGNQPNATNWATDEAFEYTFPGNDLTANDTIKVYWTDGDLRPPQKFQEMFTEKMPKQGSIFIGTEGILLQPHGELPVPYPRSRFVDYKYPRIRPRKHYNDFVDAVRGESVQPIADFVRYGGPLTETILLGALSSRFPEQTLEWDSKNLRIKNLEPANEFISKEYRKGWEVVGL